MKPCFLLTSLAVALCGMNALAQSAATPTVPPGGPEISPVAAPTSTLKAVPALTDAGSKEGCCAEPDRGRHRPAARRPSTTTPMRAKVAATTGPKADATPDHAVVQASEWLSAENRPAVGEDGRVMFTHGAGLPVLVCAPLRLCVIELQAGERVNREVQIGDSVRWIVTPAESGSGESAQTLVVIKPKEAGLDTNLLVPTDRRSYYLRLISRDSVYVARVAFHYPDEARAAWQAYSARRAELAKSEVASDLPAMSIERLQFDYDIDGDAAFRPVRVIDNGEKTYIQLPASARADEIPALVILNSEGKEQIVNSRFVNGWYEVDRLFDRAALILGVGTEQRKVVITNRSRYKRRFWDFGGEH